MLRSVATPTMLGEPATGSPPGVGYDFGLLDTHMSYSLVETEERPAETGLLTLGSSARAQVGRGAERRLGHRQRAGRQGTTAGRVSLRLNF